MIERFFIPGHTMFNKIMAVDDSEIVLNMIRMGLARLPDVQIISARNGVEAIGRLTEIPDIQLILLDINMPMMDGFTFLDIVRRGKSKYGDIPIVIISTEGEETTVMDAMRRGATAYIRKPFTLREFQKLLDELWAKSSPVKKG